MPALDSLLMLSNETENSTVTKHVGHSSTLLFGGKPSLLVSPEGRGGREPCFSGFRFFRPEQEEIRPKNGAVGALPQNPGGLGAQE